MLNLVLGIAKSGKTGHILAQLAERAAKGQESVLLVPEQYSSSAETLVYARLGDAGSARVQTLSFRTLAGRILKSAGAGGANVLDDAARAVYMRRALAAVGGKLTAFARQQRSMAFCNLAAQAVHELKIAGATPGALAEIGRRAGEQKLAELALIYESYEAAISGSALDPEDEVTKAAFLLEESGFIAGRACFVDNFDGFTAPEYTMLEALLACAAELQLALCCDGLAELDGGLGLFSPVRQTAERLIRRARRLGLPVNRQVLEPPRGEAGDLSALNRLLALGEEPESKNEPICFTPCADEYDEVRLAAAKILALARQGVPFSHMALICRSMEPYRAPVEHYFGQYGIPFFADATGSIEYSGVTAFIRAALRLLREGLGAAPLAELLKTGLCGFSEEEIAAFENYVFTWNPKAAGLRAAFAQNPEGLMARMGPAQERALALAEQVRKRLVEAAEAFLAGARGQGAGLVSRQLYLLLAEFNAPQQLAAMAQTLEQQGHAAKAADLRRSWDLAMDLLDRMEKLLQNDVVSPAEYTDLFLILVRGTDFGQVAQSVECVVFTSAERMRLSGVSHCFVLGLTEGDFPRQVGYSGLLNHTDRDLLVENSIRMPGSFENRVLLEEMFFYKALTTPTEALYLSWPRRMGGGQKSLSSAAKPVLAAFAPPALALAEQELAATPAAAFERLCALYRDGGEAKQAAALYAALQAEGGEAAPLHMLEAVEAGGRFAVRQPELVERLAGREMLLSPTRAEGYYRCGFTYYLERLVGLKPRRKAEISPMESGTYVHHVLEKVLAEAGAGFAAWENDKIRQRATFYSRSFIDENFPRPTLRETVMLQRVEQALLGLLEYMRDAAAQSAFCTAAVELEIGDGPGAVRPLEYELAGGRRVRVAGKIDRVDLLQSGGKSYLCVVDYKTGSKKFSLDDVYCGLNMQMLIYMHTLVQNAGDRFENPVPAGVLYIMADPSAKGGARQDSPAPAFEVDGLVLNDESILQCLERDGLGKYLPVKHKGGKARQSARLASPGQLARLGAHVEIRLREMAEGVYGGRFYAAPLVKGEQRPCEWCAYRQVCRHEDGRNEKEIQAPEGAFDEQKPAGQTED